MIVEDDEGVRENTAELLELYGYQTLSARNGAEGYRMAARALPDVVICDVTMPQSGGLDLLKRLRNNEDTGHIPVIFFSAGSAPREVQKGLELGANEYVSKPFTDEELLRAIHKCLRGKAMRGSAA